METVLIPGNAQIVIPVVRVIIQATQLDQSVSFVSLSHDRCELFPINTVPMKGNHQRINGKSLEPM